ncbi:DUF3500 domain-containing protein [Streptomyces sp. V4I8]|uniref:DUF3500 domain-containing protein n=1 Tax=Streptomyces sp. V4I8 TaxID=3156469 RepID=UPI0035115A41
MPPPPGIPEGAPEGAAPAGEAAEPEESGEALEQPAAQAFLDGLSAKEKRSAQYDVQDDEWPAWSNVDGYERKGVRMGDPTDERRDLGFALLGAALSADGLTRSRTIMKLNAYLGEYSGGGRETLTEGHHLAINYFVLGDQVVMTPTFMGSEPTSATYQGERISPPPSSPGCSGRRCWIWSGCTSATWPTRTPR